MKRFFQTLTLVLALGQPGISTAQGFYCNMGQPACVDPRSQICTPGAVCVAGDAVCFPGGTCGVGGFVCKAELDQCIVRHDSVVDDHNALLRDLGVLSAQFDALYAEHESLITLHNQMIDDFGLAAATSTELLMERDAALEAAADRTREATNAVRACVAAAVNLAQAKEC